MGTRTSGVTTACPSRNVFRDRSATNPNCRNNFVAFAGSGWDGLTPGVSGAQLQQGWNRGLFCFQFWKQEGALDSAGPQRNQRCDIWMQLSTAGHADDGFAKSQTVPAVCVSVA